MFFTTQKRYSNFNCMQNGINQMCLNMHFFLEKHIKNKGNLLLHIHCHNNFFLKPILFLLCKNMYMYMDILTCKSECLFANYKVLKLIYFV